MRSTRISFHFGSSASSPVLNGPTAPVMCGQPGWALESFSNSSSERKLAEEPTSSPRSWSLLSILLGIWMRPLLGLTSILLFTPLNFRLPGRPMELAVRKINEDVVVAQEGRRDVDLGATTTSSLIFLT